MATTNRSAEDRRLTRVSQICLALPEATRQDSGSHASFLIRKERGLHDPDLIAELGLGYAPGGNLRRHLADFGYSLDLLLRAGLINSQGRDAFCRRVIFPCYQQSRVINLYGRSIGAAFPLARKRANGHLLHGRQGP